MIDPEEQIEDDRQPPEEYAECVRCRRPVDDCICIEDDDIYADDVPY